MMTTDFIREASPFRPELLAHCYRMLGSVHDAEDLVQETYLRAWRAFDRFEGRSSLRTWLYKIATTVCLTALKNRGRRPMPTGLGGSANPDDDIAVRTEVPWLEPVPDALIGADDPAAIVTDRETIRLALVAALQQLPPRQRAVLILRDVLAWRAAEVAELLDTTPTAVNSVLQRARAQLDELSPDEVTEPDTPEQRELLNRYVAAFETKNVPAIVKLFTEDVVWEMPPFPEWYRGPHDVGVHLEARCPGEPGDLLLRPVKANGQPAFAIYLRDGDWFNAFLLQVLTIGKAGITHVASFVDVKLFAAFGLPEVMEP